MKAMILAAGLGTRLRPITNKKPKALIELGNTPIIEHLINRLKLLGFDQIIINVHHFANMVIDFLQSRNNFGIDIAISYENQLLNTGGGLYKARWFFDSEPFLLHNVDIFSNINILDMYKSHVDNNSLVTLAVQKEYIDRVLLINKERRICGWRNVKTNEERISFFSKELYLVSFCGLHIISPSIFSLIKDKVFSIIDLYLQLAKDHPIRAYYCEDMCIDIGTHDNLDKLKELY